MKDLEVLQAEITRLDQKGSLEKCVAQVDTLIAQLEAISSPQDSSQESQNTPQPDKTIAQLQSTLSQFQTNITSTQKSIHSTHSKFGKRLDKLFHSDYNTSYNPHSFDESSDHINRAIIMHLIRTGQIDIAQQLMKESDIEVPQTLLSQFKQMNIIVNDILKADLHLAISWCEENTNYLLSKGSQLEFQLKQQEFYKIFKLNGELDAYNYARDNFYKVENFGVEKIAKLITSILYNNNDNDNDDYDQNNNTIISKNKCETIARLFTQEFCSLVGLSPESPLYLATTAGLLSLPTLSKYHDIMINKRKSIPSNNTSYIGGNSFNGVDELSVELPLPSSLIFHPIYVCPVTKEEITKGNPAMRLPCGHIVSLQAVRNLSKGNLGSSFKCPYCPQHCSHQECMEVVFG